MSLDGILVPWRTAVKVLASLDLANLVKRGHGGTQLWPLTYDFFRNSRSRLFVIVAVSWVMAGGLKKRRSR